MPPAPPHMPNMTQIRARAITDVTTEVPAEKRIAAIAGRVRRPAAFATAQQAYRDLQTRHAALRDEERDLIAQMLAEGGETSHGSGPLVRRIRELDAELSTCSDSIREALETLLEARQPFAAAIAAALQPERTAAARRASGTTARG
jgi:hypothetical protein